MPQPSHVQSSPPPARVPAHPTSSSNGSSSDGADDDDGDEAAGKFVGGCCAAFVGAMAEGGAHDPSDVESYEPGYRSEPSYAEPHYGAGATAESVPSDGAAATESVPHSTTAFDSKSAKRSLHAAAREVKEQCVTANETLTAHRLTVSFSPDGSVSSARIDPNPESERLAKCAVAAFMRARVAPFEGEPTRVSMALEDLTPAARTDDAGPTGSGGAPSAGSPTTGSDAR